MSETICLNTSDSEIGKWEQLKYDKDYEINTKYPYPIRKKSTGKIKPECVSSNGYLSMRICDKVVLKHRLIANQFIINDSPETKNYVDHIDRNKLNNEISNLHWVTAKENSLNRSEVTYQKYEYLEKLPDEVELIEEYNEHEFDRYYFDLWGDRILMMSKSGKVKIIKPYLNGNRLVVTLFDINNVKRYIGYNKFMKYLGDTF